MFMKRNDIFYVYAVIFSSLFIKKPISFFLNQSNKLSQVGHITLIPHLDIDVYIFIS